ncbi:MAG: tripartite tricarboxylate transporter substrate binding protein [Rhodoferax sp.]|nr:tripartite tricarboxylate transporter substrate binding protein [Rhodoferax sp.]
MHRRNLVTAAVLLPAVLAASPASAQSNTTKVLVGASPGGGTDILARALSKTLTQSLGQEFIVENKPGAAGNIAAYETARAKPDGSTLLLAYTSHAINATLYPNLNFDPVKDFTPICGVARSPAFLLVSPKLNVKTLDEFLARARSKPESLNLALGGLGTASHLAGAILQQRAGIKLVGVPYKGASPAIVDVVAGHVDATIAAVAGASQQVRDGMLVAIGVTSEQRLAAFPDVPTIAETFPGYESSAWFGLFGPAGMDSSVVEKLSNAVLAALNSDELKHSFKMSSMISMAMKPKAFGDYVSAEIVKWGDVVKSAGIKPA